MPRLTLAQCAASRLPEAIGVCAGDLPQIAANLNAAEQRLVYAKEAGDQGWYGSFAEMAFNVLKSDPYIALGRWGARLIAVTVCKRAIAINNQFYEYLQFGNGRQPRFDCSGHRTSGLCGLPQGYARGTFPTWRDMVKGHKLRFRCVDTLDEAGTRRVFVQGTNTADHTVTSLDGSGIRAQGIWLTFKHPFVDTPFALNSLTGLQKDPTNGPIEVWDVDPATGTETLLLTMEGGEMVSGYPRYYLNGLPLNCCPVVQVNGVPTVQVTALVKLNMVPVIAPTDYLLIQNLEALIAECQSLRYSTVDSPAAQQLSLKAHRDAIGLLNGELAHFYGVDNPAVSFMPFGSARLERQAIGTLM